MKRNVGYRNPGTRVAYSGRMKKRTSTRTLATLSLLVAVAMLLSYVEHLVPPIYPVLPAIKCGLANVAVVFALYRLGDRSAAGIALLKVILTALLFGSFVSLAYSATGAALSLVAMLLLKRIDRFSPVGVSVVGGVMHNAGQIIVAALMVRTPEIALYFPILAVTGTLAGIVVGLIGATAVKHIRTDK